jgi:hypothetical protein
MILVMLCQRWPGKTENRCRLFLSKQPFLSKETHFYSFAKTTACCDAAGAKVAFGQIKDK